MHRRTYMISIKVHIQVLALHTYLLEVFSVLTGMMRPLFRLTVGGAIMGGHQTPRTSKNDDPFHTSRCNKANRK